MKKKVIKISLFAIFITILTVFGIFNLINNISKEIPVVCFNASYNKSCTSDNIYRAYSWYDVYYNIIYKIMVN